jgi:hypothetical protein
MAEIEYKVRPQDAENIEIGIQELIDYTFGKPGHLVWINGQAVMLRTFTRNVKFLNCDHDKKIYLGICEDLLKQLSVLAHNPQATGTYFTFGG